MQQHLLVVHKQDHKYMFIYPGGDLRALCGVLLRFAHNAHYNLNAVDVRNIMERLCRRTMIEAMEEVSL